MFFYGDSFGYLASAQNPAPATHPIGYPLLLGALRPLHQVAVIPAVQHLMGLATGVLIYFALRRVGLPNAFAALGAAPVLLDGYQVHIETFIMAETLTQFLVVLALSSLLWSRVPSIVTTALAGGALGYAAISRTATIVLILPALVFAIVRAFGVVRVVVLLLAFASPVVWHTIWFHSEHNRYALSTNDGIFLYTRVAPFADCGVVEPRLRPLCDSRPVADRPESTWFMWNADSPLRRHRPPPDTNVVARDFAFQVIRHQPFDYAKVVGSEFAHYFGLRRWGGPGNAEAGTWQFPHVLNYQDEIAQAIRGYGDSTRATINQGTAPYLRAYHGIVSTPGVLLALLLLAPLLVRGPGRPWPRAEFLLLASAGLLLLLAPTMMVEFENRFFLPTLPLLSAAAAVGAYRVAGWIKQGRSASRGVERQNGVGQELQSEPTAV